MFYIKHFLDFNGVNGVNGGGGSLALLLRHKNCPNDGRAFATGERLTQRVRQFHPVKLKQFFFFF